MKNQIIDHNPWIDHAANAYFQQCIEREAREANPNAVAREVEALREQQDHQFYQNQMIQNAEEYVNTKKFYKTSPPDPEYTKMVNHTMSILNKCKEYDKKNNINIINTNDVPALLFLLVCVFIAGGLIFIGVLAIVGLFEKVSNKFQRRSARE